VIAYGPSKKRSLSAPVLVNLGINVANKYSVSQDSLGSRQPALSGARRSVSGSPKIAVEAVATQSNRGDRELSSATLWNRYVHYRPVRGHIGGVRDSSIAGAASERYGTRI